MSTTKITPLTTKSHLPLASQVKTLTLNSTAMLLLGSNVAISTISHLNSIGLHYLQVLNIAKGKTMKLYANGGAT